MRIRSGKTKTKQLQHRAAKKTIRTYDPQRESKWFCQNKTIVLNPQLSLIKTPSKKNPMGKTLKGEKEYLVKTTRDPTKLTKSKIWQTRQIIRNKRRSRMPQSRGLNTGSSRSQTIYCLVPLTINMSNTKTHMRNPIQA